MTEWRLGHEVEARSLLDQAAERIRETYPADPELRRRANEAKLLLGDG